MLKYRIETANKAQNGEKIMMNTTNTKKATSAKKSNKHSKNKEIKSRNQRSFNPYGKNQQLQIRKKCSN